MRMNAFSISASAYTHSSFPNSHSSSHLQQPQHALLQNRKIQNLCNHGPSLKKLTLFNLNSRRRTTFICAAKGEAEEAFKKTVELDRLIDMLRDANPRELQKLVGENILAFNPNFWTRLAARSDTCKSEDDKKDYEELATSVMSVVDLMVLKTKERIESATDVLKGILKPVVNDEGEIPWPPRDPQALTLMEMEINQRGQVGQLDEGFLAEVSAQQRQAKEDGDKPGLEAMLQKVLQLYASKSLSKRSYAMKAPEQEWNGILIKGLTIGAGDVSPEELYAVLKKRRERILIRTEGGSYQQRILTEYLKGIETRAHEIVQVLQSQGKPQ
ncbi:uncharacterized protein LOC127101944 isoform X2 [Lathyrus oleraceus]|uniref:Uncharacterized protein n=1 Tax=Pisum sativum TaxID=3888 RepID=A0A9D4VT70_PEA|nr:uncharacterized protein LOC127101944 isoform X2 [Pisum sativum]KAI5388444.1 hypothetical protein KIW84_074218 [Pisum sativum]